MINFQISSSSVNTRRWETSMAIVLNGQNDQYAKVKYEEENCVIDIEKCAESGITFGFRFKLTRLRANTVIISSGGERDDSHGIAIIYVYGGLQVTVSSQTTMWSVFIKNVMSINKFLKLDISWKVADGLSCYMDGMLVARQPVGISRVKKISSLGLQSILYIGRPTVFEGTDYKAAAMWFESFYIYTASFETLVRAGVQVSGKICIYFSIILYSYICITLLCILLAYDSC